MQVFEINYFDIKTIVSEKLYNSIKCIFIPKDSV